MGDYGWGCQLCNWGDGFGSEIKGYLMKSSVSALTKPADAVSFTYDTVGKPAGDHPVIPGYLTATLPTQLSWVDD